MNRSKIIGATALASVMAAGAAQAEMSLSGYFAGTVSDMMVEEWLQHSLLTRFISRTVTLWITVWALA